LKTSSAHPPREVPESPRASDIAAAPPAGDASDDVTDGPPEARLDLAGLSVAGITRRRVGWVSAAFVAIWIVVVFARQVGDAQAATNRAQQLAAGNAALASEVDALQKELDLIVQPSYVQQEARAHRFGNPKEIPFSLDPSIRTPVDGAPGSASVRLGATADEETPLESWLSLLFGPTT